MSKNPLTGDFAAVVAALLARLDDVDRAVTPGEEAQARLALQVEGSLQWAAHMERTRQRLLAKLKTELAFDRVLYEAGEDPLF